MVSLINVLAYKVVTKVTELYNTKDFNKKIQAESENQN